MQHILASVILISFEEDVELYVVPAVGTGRLGVEPLRYALVMEAVLATGNNHTPVSGLKLEQANRT